MPAAGPALGARRWCKRIGWLLVFWVLGVAVLGVVALSLKAVMRLVGL
jgi:hypothetical protein